MSVEQDWSAWPRRDASQAPNGYIYVIGFDHGVVKVGRTDSPWSRVREHQRAAAKFGSTLRRAWLSPLHGDWVANEGRLIAEGARVGSLVGGREYFQGSYEALVDFASSLDMARVEPLPPAPLVVSAEFRERVIDVRYAFAGESWRTMGYATWEEYCAAELADLHTRKLTRDERLYMVTALRMPLAEFERANGLDRCAAYVR